MENIASDKKFWELFIEEPNLFTLELPAWIENEISAFEKLLLFKSLRPEKLEVSLKKQISTALGEDFIKPPPFDIPGTQDDSTPINPIIFILSPGADPLKAVEAFAKSKGIEDDKFLKLSMGQGQGVIAKEQINMGQQGGHWVVLQNCHLAASWMPTLEAIQEQQDEASIDPRYRLILTSMPSAKFPVPILQSGIKITNEPPNGVRANLMRTFLNVNEEMWSESSKLKETRRLLFALAFFHAAILERRKFGPIGWNIPYEWMDSDFETCQKQLRDQLEAGEDIPFKTLKFLISEVNQGGRITDDKDIRSANALIQKFFGQVTLEEGFSFDDDGLQQPNDDDDINEVKNYIDKLPTEDEPQLFALHNNANITYEFGIANDILEVIKLLNARVAGAGAGNTPEQMVAEIARDMDTRVPMRDIPTYPEDVHADTQFCLPGTKDMNSLGVFIKQESERFNQLLKIIRASLKQLQLAIKGLVSMGQDLEKMFDALLVLKVPPKWQTYPSLKPIGPWYEDFLQRIVFIEDWMKNGPPTAQWVSSFFFPQGFMTAVMQVFSRKNNTAIDTLKFKTNVLPIDLNELRTKAQSGANVQGLYLQGANQDRKAGCLVESNPRELFVQMPIIHLEPVPITREDDPTDQECPLYKTSERKGVLSTTGHSTNFVLFFRVKTGASEKEHWVRRGTAMLCQLDN